MSAGMQDRHGVQWEETLSIFLWYLVICQAKRPAVIPYTHSASLRVTRSEGKQAKPSRVLSGGAVGDSSLLLEAFRSIFDARYLRMFANISLPLGMNHNLLSVCSCFRRPTCQIPVLCRHRKRMRYQMSGSRYELLLHWQGDNSPPVAYWRYAAFGAS